MTLPHSDALVLFGATGDLADKMIFPALYQLVKGGALKVPVIGVASRKWSVAQLREHVKQSIEGSGGLTIPPRCTGCCRGSATSAPTTTSRPPSRRSGRRSAAPRPAHYLAIPPALFETVIKGLGRRVSPRSAGHRREAVRP